MQLKRIAVNIFAIIVSFLIAGLVAGGVAIPYLIVTQYDAQMRHAALSLQKEFAALENSTYLPLVDDPSAPSERKQRDSQITKERITSTLEQMTVFERTANTLDPWPFPDLANFYHDGQIVREKSLTIAAQTRAIIKEYDSIISFLEFYNKIVDDTREENNKFNTIANFNEFAGRGDEFRTIATKLRSYITALEQRSAPDELNLSASQLKTLLDKTATQYESLGAGLDVAIDKNIYDAVAAIEAANRELETPHGQTYIATLENSRVIRDIRQLEQKLDPLTLTK